MKMPFFFRKSFEPVNIELSIYLFICLSVSQLFSNTSLMKLSYGITYLFKTLMFYFSVRPQRHNGGEVQSSQILSQQSQEEGDWAEIDWPPNCSRLSGNTDLTWELCLIEQLLGLMLFMLPSHKLHISSYVDCAFQQGH